MVIGLLSFTAQANVDLIQQSCQLSSAILQLPRPNDTDTAVLLDAVPRTSVLHAAVSTPNVVCLHLLCDLTPKAEPTDAPLWPSTCYAP